ncbi:TPA: hypothetical protein ACGO6U_000936 [Streptococcus suis]
MNRTEAMQTVESLLKNNFKYLYKKEKLNIFELHLSFQMDSKTHELQTSMDFKDTWVDILTFISPTALKVGSDEYYEVLKTVNYVNWYTKANGRFHVDTYGDLAYSLRIKYDFLEAEPHMAINEIETAIDYYADLFVPLLDVCLGKKSFNDAKTFIDEMWGDKVNRLH